MLPITGTVSVAGLTVAHIARCDSIPLAPRCASGSSRSIQADLEYLSRPHDPRIRDPGQPNVYLPTTRELMERKTKLLHAHFSSQRSKDWFDGPGAPARHGMSRARLLRRSLPCEKAHGAMTFRASPACARAPVRTLAPSCNPSINGRLPRSFLKSSHGRSPCASDERCCPPKLSRAIFRATTRIRRGDRVPAVHCKGTDNMRRRV